MIISAKGSQNVGQIQNQFIFGNLFLSPEEYQRENAWGPVQKQILIDTAISIMESHSPSFQNWTLGSLLKAPLHNDIRVPGF